MMMGIEALACLNGSVSSRELFIRSVDVLNRASLLESRSTVEVESAGCSSTLCGEANRGHRTGRLGP